MESLPIFMRIASRRCLVIGGGEVALRKVTMLLKAQGAVEVISPEFCHELIALAEQKSIKITKNKFLPVQMDGAMLVIAATDDESVNTQISLEAQARNIPVNVVDAPALCTFTMPAIIDRSPLVIAISSNGAAPVLARLIRAKVETMVPASYGLLANLARDFRDDVKAKFGSTQARRIFWEKIFQGPIAELMFSGQAPAAKLALKAEIEASEDHQQHGEVYLVGGGPGDPDLLTFRALRLMQQCDVCVYDKLVSPEVMELVRRDAELIYVGKARDQHTLPQEDINDLLVKLAKQGKRVLRLKGGDPFIFGRGGEEIETLMENGVPFQVVPGITAANGVSSYAGIPLTHRDYAQSCVFTTGHLKTIDGKNQHIVELDWPALARANQTVVIYMGLIALPQICEQLIAHGMPANMPAAVVQQGTTLKQKVVVGDLSDLAEKTLQAELKTPCLVIVGEVVKLRQKLSWFNP